jgi:hypothetical protein
MRVVASMTVLVVMIYWRRRVRVVRLMLRSIIRRGRVR